LGASQEALEWLGSLDFPDFERDYNFVALRHPDEYPFNEGRLVSTSGMDIGIEEFENRMEEEHVKRSNALHAYLKESGPYHVGPLARYNLNFDLLSPIARKAAEKVGLGPVVRNPFKSLLVRLVEIIYAFDEALRIIDGYQPPAEPFVELTPKAGRGYGCTEAPRGICYHRYDLAEDGTITSARIIPPTSQNLRTMEIDLEKMIPGLLDMPNDELTWRCEQAIRNYDPCISCATHFLKLDIEYV
jgi:coenzyme F420-reducing hydrogenase alpha subunit